MTSPDLATDGHPTDLWEAYASSELIVRVHDRDLAVQPAAAGEHGGWPFGDVRTAWVITAWNPRSVWLSPHENAARAEALVLDLDAAGLAHLPAIAGADDWYEDCAVVLSDDADAVAELARAYDQNAVFRWTPDEWAVVGVLLPGIRSLGWSLTSVPVEPSTAATTTIGRPER